MCILEIYAVNLQDYEYYFIATNTGNVLPLNPDFCNREVVRRFYVQIQFQQIENIIKLGVLYYFMTYFNVDPKNACGAVLFLPISLYIPHLLV